MGSKVSLQTKRLKKAEFAAICNNIDKQIFLDYYLNNGNEAVCAHFNFGLNTMYRLVKYFGIKLTNEQLKFRNKIASKQRVQALYGVDNNFQRKEVQNLIKENNISKYGVPNQFQRQEIKDKTKQTLLAKYGVEFIAQSSEIHSRAQTKYLYDNERFDSFPELAVWVYAKDHNIKITREPCKFKYMVDNKEHYYFPDFDLNGQLIEIKGLQFFKDKNPNEIMINPYDSSRNKQAEAKHQCAIKNNVLIWTENDYNKYVDYVLANYNIDSFIKLTKK